MSTELIVRAVNEYCEKRKRLTAKEFLRRSGIRDLVLRHEGLPSEQTMSLVMEEYAQQCWEPK